MYTSGRCAISHAWAQPIADPDDPIDQQRLRDDRIIIKELAAIAIEDELGIKSEMSNYRDGNNRTEKLLESLGKETLELLKNGKEVKNAEIKYPVLKMGIRGKEIYKITEELNIFQLEANAEEIVINTISKNKRAIVRIFVDLEKNDIFIEPFNEIYKNNDINIDDKENAELELSCLMLKKDYLMNGQLRIYTPDDGLLATSTPFLPTNIDVGRTVRNLNELIEQQKQKIQNFEQDIV